MMIQVQLRGRKKPFPQHTSAQIQLFFVATAFTWHFQSLFAFSAQSFGFWIFNFSYAVCVFLKIPVCKWNFCKSNHIVYVPERAYYLKSKVNLFEIK